MNNHVSTERAHLNEVAGKSAAHKYVVEKFRNCTLKFFASADGCAVQAVSLAKMQGPEFEQQAYAAMRNDVMPFYERRN